MFKRDPLTSFCRFDLECKYSRLRSTVVHGANNARGVAILIRNNFDCFVEQKVADTYGRFLILKVLLNREQTLLVNIYGPNRDNELVAFYLSLLQTVAKNDFDTIENIIMGGDFNCPLNPTVDKRGGNLFPRQSVLNTIEELQSELDLHDIWRIKTPTTRSYTFFFFILFYNYLQHLHN